MVTAGKREWNRNLKRSLGLQRRKRARPLQPTIGVREVPAPGCVEMKRMKRQATVAGVIGAGLIYAMAASADPYNPGERALGGGLLGAGTGALIGAIAGGGRGAGTSSIATTAIIEDRRRSLLGARPSNSDDERMMHSTGQNCWIAPA